MAAQTGLFTDPEERAVATRPVTPAKQQRKGSRRAQVAFETSTTTVGIRGTDIEIAVAEEPVGSDPAGTYLKVNSGSAVMVAIDGTQVAVDPGQEAFGGEPELVPRGSNAKPRPAARRVEESGRNREPGGRCA